MPDLFTFLHADITTLEVDALVNAANTSLRGGGGVDGAIHHAAGPQLLEECRTLGGCPTGGAKISKGYNLKAKWVIHTVGPVWRGGEEDEDRLLARCYHRCLDLAEAYQVESIAFPAISTGVYAFPLKRATTIALTTVRQRLAEGSPITGVVFACFGEDVLKVYQDVAQGLG